MAGKDAVTYFASFDETGTLSSTIKKTVDSVSKPAVGSYKVDFTATDLSACMVFVQPIAAGAVRHTEATVNSTNKDVVDVRVKDGMALAVDTALVVGVMC